LQDLVDQGQIRQQRANVQLIDGCGDDLKRLCPPDSLIDIGQSAGQVDAPRRDLVGIGCATSARS
jgi:hypothetical protein